MTETKVLPLQNAYSKYCEGTIGKRELESIIFAFVLKHPRRFYLNRWDQDECFDFLCWVYPRLGKAIERYRDQGSTFEAYMSSVIRWSFREFRFKMRDQKALEYSWWNAQAMDLCVTCEEPDYLEFDDKNPAMEKIKNPKQILFLLLKCYYFLSDDFISWIAPALNMDKEELISMIDNLHEVRTHQEEEIRLLKERINCQYYRCITFESRMNAANEGSSHYEKMKRSLEKGRKRLRSMRKRLSTMRIGASNKQVADLLGVPKGTVDSSLYALKEKAGIR